MPLCEEVNCFTIDEAYINCYKQAKDGRGHFLAMVMCFKYMHLNQNLQTNPHLVNEVHFHPTSAFRNAQS